MAWINVIPAEAAEDELKAAYEKLGVDSGPMWPPYEVLTNNGPALLRLNQFSDVVRFGSSPLSRLQREMVSTLVSALNGCVF